MTELQIVNTGSDSEEMPAQTEQTPDLIDVDDERTALLIDHSQYNGDEPPPYFAFDDAQSLEPLPNYNELSRLLPSGRPLNRFQLFRKFLSEYCFDVTQLLMLLLVTGCALIVVALALLPLLTHWFDAAVPFTPAFPPFDYIHPPQSLPVHFEPAVLGFGYCHHENQVIAVAAPISIDSSTYNTIRIEATGRGWMKIHIADTDDISDIQVEPHFHISEIELEKNVNVMLRNLPPRYDVMLHTPILDETSSDCYTTNVKVTIPLRHSLGNVKLVLNVPHIHIDADFKGSSSFESVEILALSMNIFNLPSSVVDLVSTDTIYGVAGSFSHVSMLNVTSRHDVDITGIDFDSASNSHIGIRAGNRVSLAVNSSYSGRIDMESSGWIVVDDVALHHYEGARGDGNSTLQIASGDAGVSLTWQDSQ
ncbi:hypothetical protein SmJEL517_g02815 [Synchytrium microbalum]|uniref:Adhesin domain-containing protein n=1 Tax=Synchytrium microbalum TaxID=1806994 RepID=A0A507C0G3_9FUNG|nr:uncharacterized protein SmJEL517_g02815 [Synchytrium microbalum]TPX34567.1 hypothetical protein SmJEL517_g02815 [Synchytrium microbalum]